MIDVDHFKGYNDAGHLAGDNALRSAKICSTDVVHRLLVARYGPAGSIILLDVGKGPRRGGQRICAQVPNSRSSSAAQPAAG
jgi:PleD family two-component response regulator